ncbi:MAG: hypothetical protein FD131_4420 [Rhodocyclaceae bacterium]|nr:MAG: hypothetical protein FD131_4420 [Rhodocyclaceae bacterium]
MNTNGSLAGQNGHGVRQGMAAAALTAGISVQMPRAVRNGVVLYGQVPSRHEASRRYWVKKRRVGTGRFAYACSCEGSFLGNNLCSHIALFKLAEGTQ